MNFLAFDLGASSGRAILGTLENGRLELQEVHRFANGHKEIDKSLYWDYPALVNELKEGLRKAVSITEDIAAIGVDTWGVDYVLFDKDTVFFCAKPAYSPVHPLKSLANGTFFTYMLLLLRYESAPASVAKRKVIL